MLINFVIYFPKWIHFSCSYYIDIVEGFDKFCLLKFVANSIEIVTINIPYTCSSVGNRDGGQLT